VSCWQQQLTDSFTNTRFEDFWLVSYTLQIYLEREVDQNALVDCLTDLGLSLHSESLMGCSEELVFFDQDENPIVILGPVRLSQPEVHSNGNIATSWLVTVDVPGDVFTIPPLISAFASKLNTVYGGFFVDPQISDSSSSSGPIQQASQTFSFLWCTDYENLEAASIPEFLELVHRHFSGLFPSLCGFSEPLQFSYSGKPLEQKQLLKILEESDVFYVRSVDSSIFLKFYLDAESLDDSCAMVEMTLLDWATNTSDKSIQDCFQLVCKHFNCFYGGVIVGASGSRSLPSPLWQIDRHGFWNGIPTNYTWLAWFDEPLLSKVSSYFPVEFWGPGSHLVRMSESPATEEKLSSIFPRLPDSLLDLDGELRSRPLGQ